MTENFTLRTSPCVLMETQRYLCTTRPTASMIWKVNWYLAFILERQWVEEKSKWLRCALNESHRWVSAYYYRSLGRNALSPFLPSTSPSSTLCSSLSFSLPFLFNISKNPSRKSLTIEKTYLNIPGKYFNFINFPDVQYSHV